MSNKPLFSLLFLACLLTGPACTPLEELTVTAPCTTDTPVNPAYPNGEALSAALQSLATAGAPGVALAVYDESNGWWEGTAGYARIENQTALQPCHLQYLQSIAKTYLAVAILQLHEAGQIQLDAPIATYLPARYYAFLPDIQEITVKMLLNHTSGLPEYNFAPAYVTQLLQYPDRVFGPDEYLGFIKGKPLDFTPGSQYSYRNTNYLVLALMADAVTGDHARYLRTHIFEPLGLTHTFYHNDPGYLANPLLVNSYWDRYGNGRVENVTAMQRTNVSSLIGDDGIVTTPADAVRFLRGLMEGDLLSDTSMVLMKTWVINYLGNPTYGLGLDKAEIHGKEAWGHSGGGIGAGGELYFYPEKGIYIFLAMNLGTVTDSKLHTQIEPAREALYSLLLD